MLNKLEQRQLNHVIKLYIIGKEYVISSTKLIDRKTKELIALGIAVTVRCDGCIAFHVHDAMQAGATKEEIVETVSVSILMGGGPSVVYGIEAMQAVEHYQAQGL